MKYLTYLAAVGLVEAKTALIIDDAKIVQTVQNIADAVETEVSRPEAEAVADAIAAEIEKAAIKVDLSLNKLVTPVLDKAAEEIEIFSFNEECKVHRFYQCIVDDGSVEYGPWSAA